MNGATILCVSHGVVIQTLLSVLLAGPYMDPNHYVPANGSIHTVRFRNGNLSDFRIGSIV